MKLHFLFDSGLTTILSGNSSIVIFACSKKVVLISVKYNFTKKLSYKSIMKVALEFLKMFDNWSKRKNELVSLQR